MPLRQQIFHFSLFTITFFLYLCVFIQIEVMDVEAIKKIIEKEPNLSTALGMEFYSTPEEDTCMAVMQVDQRNRQPFGFLSGGASLALAENVAGVGSSALCPGKICVGISVSGDHVKAKIVNSSNELISNVHVTNYIITPKKGKG